MICTVKYHTFRNLFNIYISLRWTSEYIDQWTVRNASSFLISLYKMELTAGLDRKAWDVIADRDKKNTHHILSMVDFQYRVKHEYPHRSDLKKLSSLITYSSILISWFVLKCHKGTQASFQSIQNPDVMAEDLACPRRPYLIEDCLIVFHWKGWMAYLWYKTKYLFLNKLNVKWIQFVFSVIFLSPSV